MFSYFSKETKGEPGAETQGSQATAATASAGAKNMPEVHPGTDIEIPSAVPSSAFRVKIPNKERYMKFNSVSLADVAAASRCGDYDALEIMLATGNASQLFNGDLNAHHNGLTCLHYAAATGNMECAELLLQAGADPHMKEAVGHGRNPEDGKTALQRAAEAGWQDTVEVLTKAEKQTPYGAYVPAGPEANKKIYGGWEWQKAPEKGWYFKRPFAAVSQGLAPAQFGVSDPSPGVPSSSSSKGKVARKTGLLLSGFASCKLGLLRSCQDERVVQVLVDKATQVFGFDMLSACNNEEQLWVGGRPHMCMMVAVLAGIELLKGIDSQAGHQPTAVFGLDVGQYAVLHAAGVLTLEDAMLLVKTRAEAIEEAQSSAKKYKSMTVAMLTKDVLVPLCKEAAASEPGGVCEVSGAFFAKGFGVAGTAAAVEKLEALAKAKGGKCKAAPATSQTIANTSMMAGAQVKLSKKLDEVQPRMKSAQCAVYLNPTGEELPRGTGPSKIVAALKTELVSCVQVQAALENMVNSGVKHFYEVSPTVLLKNFMKMTNPEVAETMQVVEV